MPNFHFMLFAGSQVSTELAIEVCFLFWGADPDFSHDKEGKESDDKCVSVRELT